MFKTRFCVRKAAHFLPVLSALLFNSFTCPAASPRETASFDRTWKFHLGEAAGAEKSEFDDSTWQPVDLPHDWMIEGVPGKDPSAMEGPFDKNSPAGKAAAT